MKGTKAFLPWQPWACILMATFFVSGGFVFAQEIQHLSIIQPGGMPGLPIMTGIERITNGVRVTWDGPSGYYQLLQKLSIKDPTWLLVGGRTNLLRNAIVSNTSSNAFFRVLGPSPQYAGAQACTECHGEVHNAVMNTRHSLAFETLKQAHEDKNPSCLPCHTVGNKAPTGFTSEIVTPELAGVQCENCHSSAGNHAANPEDPVFRPRIEMAATMCGGCHNAQFVPAAVAASHRPYYEEWNASAHRAVRDELKADFAESSDQILSCGRCHSGAAREALLENDPLPSGHEAGAVGIVCSTCHDPHQQYVWTNVIAGIVYTNQLRQALSSTNDFFLTTSDTFSNKYDATINICAQCHNHRGASWTSSSRSPHHSPQYNMLLGTVGVLPDGVSGGPAAHAGTKFLSDSSGRMFLVTNQCVTCHMQRTDFQSGPPQIRPGSGHKFVVSSYQACADCHGSGANAEGLVALLSGLISGKIQQVKNALDTWAATKAPDSLYATYGNRAWEYTNPGDLSPGGPGPSSNEQSLIPDNIKKARFDLYLVLYDGSSGVHNGPYAFTLLEAAHNWVQEELNK